VREIEVNRRWRVGHLGASARAVPPGPRARRDAKRAADQGSGHDAPEQEHGPIDLEAIARVTCTLRRREPFDRAREARAIVPRLIDLRVARRARRRVYLSRRPPSALG
jgi:hypothetical protein